MDSHSLLAPNSRYYSPCCSQRDSRLNNVRLSAANDEQPATLRRKLHNQRIHSKRQQQSIKETVPEMVLSSQQLILMRKDYPGSPRDRAVDASTDKTLLLLNSFYKSLIYKKKIFSNIIEWVANIKNVSFWKVVI